MARQQGVVAGIRRGRRPRIVDGACRRGGSTRRGRAVRSLFDVAHVSSVTAVWGTFLYLCASADARTDDPGVGHRRRHLGLLSRLGAVVPAIHHRRRQRRIAPGWPRRHLRRIVANAEVLNASFEAALDRLLPGAARRHRFGVHRRRQDPRQLPRAARPPVAPAEPRRPGRLRRHPVVRRAGGLGGAARTRPDSRLSSTPAGSASASGMPAAVRPQAFTLYGLGGVDVYQVRRGPHGEAPSGRRPEPQAERSEACPLCAPLIC